MADLIGDLLIILAVFGLGCFAHSVWVEWLEERCG